MPVQEMIACPSCRAAMEAHRFTRKLGGDVVLDLCFSCQGIWFDDYESLQLSPQSVIALFRLIHEHEAGQRLPLAGALYCPRCSESLVHLQDRVKSGRFNYLRCRQHGRFTTFAQFMIEKGFVRQVTPAEIGELKLHVALVRCASCGAPVDIRKQSACGHCRAPIAILDAAAVEKALAGYLHGDAGRAPAAVPPGPALQADTMLHQARERSRAQRDGALDTDIVDLLQEGAATVWDMVRK